MKYCELNKEYLDKKLVNRIVNNILNPLDTKTKSKYHNTISDIDAEVNQLVLDKLAVEKKAILQIYKSNCQDAKFYSSSVKDKFYNSMTVLADYSFFSTDSSISKLWNKPKGTYLFHDHEIDSTQKQFIVVDVINNDAVSEPLFDFIFINLKWEDGKWKNPEDGKIYDSLAEFIKLNKELLKTPNPMLES